MSFDRLKSVRPEKTDKITGDAEYIKTLAALPDPAPKKNILPIVGTVAAALLIAVGVSLWAIIGRGVRGGADGGDEFITPADKTEDVVQTAPSADPSPAAVSLSDTEYLTYTDEEYRQLCDVYFDYVLPAMPEFTVGTVPQKADVIRYAEAVRPSLFDDGRLTAAELNTFAYEFFGIITEYTGDTDYKGGVAEKSPELWDPPAVRCLATTVTDGGKRAVTVGYSEPNDDYREFIKSKIEYITYVTDGDGLSPLYIIEHRVGDGVSTLDNAHGVAAGSEAQIPTDGQKKAEYLELIKSNAILALPLFERGKMPDAADTLRYLYAIGEDPQSATQMNTLVQTYFGHQGMVSSIPAIPEIATVYDYGAVTLLSAHSYKSTVSDVTCTRLVYGYNQKTYAVEFTDGDVPCFIAHTVTEGRTVTVERWDSPTSATSAFSDGEELYGFLNSLEYDEGECVCFGKVRLVFSGTDGGSFKAIVGDDGKNAHIVCDRGVHVLSAAERSTFLGLLVADGASSVTNINSGHIPSGATVTVGGEKRTLTQNDAFDAYLIFVCEDYGDAYCDCGSVYASFDIDGAAYSVCGCDAPRMHSACGGKLLTAEEYEYVKSFIDRITA